MDDEDQALVDRIVGAIKKEPLDPRSLVILKI
jgi:hypothetical protein